MGQYSFPVPNCSGTFDDVGLAKRQNVDLYDDTGLTDGFPTGGVGAHDASEVVQGLLNETMAIGNHELYIYNSTLDMHTNFHPPSMADISPHTSASVNGTYPHRLSLSKSYHCSQKTTSFGILFDFTENDNNTIVHWRVELLVQQSWFARAIKDKPFLFWLDKCR